MGQWSFWQRLGNRHGISGHPGCPSFDRPRTSGESMQSTPVFTGAGSNLLEGAEGSWGDEFRIDASYLIVIDFGG